MDVEIFGNTYDFPAIKDGRFSTLQEDIAQTRRTIEEGSKEQSSLFGLRKSPPSLPPERRLELMEHLVGRYDELLAYLKSRIGDCRSAFEGIGEGVRRSFEAKVRELETMEARRAALAEELKSLGKGEQASMLDAERERIRSLARNLAEASLLIIRKLRHALEALEVLASDGTSQRDVLEALRGDVGVYRKVWEFNRDLNRLQDDIEELTRTALQFDSILRDNLGPLGILVDEIAKVDGRMAESLAEIQALSARLEKNQAADGASLGGNILDILVGARVKADLVSSILERLASDQEAPFDGFDLEIASGSDLDFHALAENMSALVNQGLKRLGGPSPEPAALIEETPVSPAQAAAQKEEQPSAAQAEASVSTETDESTEPSAQADPGKAPAQSLDAVPEWARRAESTASGGSSSIQRKKPDSASYRAAISRADPTLIVFLLDRSGSMDSPYAAGTSKAEFLARTVDRALYELAVRCMRPDGVRDYFHVACLGYNDGKVISALPEALAGEDWIPISKIAASPARLEDIPGGGKEPRWIRAMADGDTPMCSAFERACQLAAAWCDAHPKSYPPTIINVSDGEPTDGDPRPIAEVLQRLHTDDGETLVFNLHVSSDKDGEVAFPSDPSCLDEFGRRLFEMSSRFPPHLLARASQSGIPAGADSRFFAYGAGADLATKFLELGTRPAGLR